MTRSEKGCWEDLRLIEGWCECVWWRVNVIVGEDRVLCFLIYLVGGWCVCGSGREE